jgi:hypothetical protein
MIETIIRPGRNVVSGDKVLIDDTRKHRLIFFNEPTIPAFIPDGMRMKMKAPVTVVGASQIFELKDFVCAEYAHGELKFENGKSLPLSSIRGQNWFEVIEVPQQA